MQALSNIQWFSDLINDRHEKMACSKPRHISAVETSLFNKLKRKMTDTNYDVVSSSEERAPKRIKAHPVAPIRPTEQPLVKAEPATIALSPISSGVASEEILASADKIVQSCGDDLTEMATSLKHAAKLRQKIEAQINLEILLKHQELRLIEQELGKCQIAMEQLRRCQTIPFPGELGSPLTGEEVSAGTGPALQSVPGFTQPPHPAPWGVVDGPYSRHYARWLIPDPQFDSVPIAPARVMQGGKSTSMETRHTRGSIVERGPAIASRSHRASLASKQQPMSYAGLPRDRLAPLLIKHPQTGEMVKLVCKYCGKNNINSVQGFLNHCRIAHEKNYESHGAAAIDCGVSLDGTETLLTPLSAEPSTPIIPSGRPLVHPLIMGDRVARKPSNASSSPMTPVHPVSASPARQLSWHSRPTQPSPLAQTFDTETFIGSAQMPRLSKLFQMRGKGGNLGKEIASATVRVNLDDITSLDDEEEENPEAPEKEPSVNSSRRFVKPEQNEAARTPRSEANNSVKPPRNAPLSLASSNTEGARSSFSEHSLDDDTNLSPHTVDTNPGLMSDDEDEEERDYDHEADVDSDHHGQDVRVRVHEYDGRADADEVMQDPENRGESSADHEKMISAAGVLDAKHNEAPVPKRKRGRPSKGGAGRSKGGR